LVIKNCILTRDNLKKIKVEKAQSCAGFCDGYESQEHPFFVRPLARYIWNVIGVSLNLKNMPVSFESL
jgi:hypothetical protein